MAFSQVPCSVAGLADFSILWTHQTCFLCCFPCLERLFCYIFMWPALILHLGLSSNRSYLITTSKSSPHPTPNTLSIQLSCFSHGIYYYKHLYCLLILFTLFPLGKSCSLFIAPLYPQRLEELCLVHNSFEYVFTLLLEEISIQWNKSSRREFWKAVPDWIGGSGLISSSLIIFWWTKKTHF